MLAKRIEKIPLGYSEVLYNDKKYGLTKNEFNNGKSFKIYAEELGGNDFISLNYYSTTSKNLLKPCEMTKQKVVHFIKNIKLL
jgi:hypothetical protein